MSSISHAGRQAQAIVQTDEDEGTAWPCTQHLVCIRHFYQKSNFHNVPYLRCYNILSPLIHPSAEGETGPVVQSEI